MADVSQGWPWQLPLLATPACVRCHPPPLRDGWDQVLTDTGDAGDVAAAASVTRDRRGQAALAAPGRCAAAVLQACSGHHLECPPAALHRPLNSSGTWPRPTANSSSSSGGAGCCQVLDIFPSRTQLTLPTHLTWNIQFSFPPC